ncbi:putative UDP-glucuronosyltransferase 2A3 [Mollisia scopiformis]|uniref:Putative UDP-glucuronosyltransferase 2A3 n=1 Tax=Mollisia scopiformis TaxID=149040 RepID=A0A194X9J1_MOLSC|nr:putative UDP-glucuronosyltransferase 2A3 [Mollisia scopiformis]KUJ16794.1 putative UDP-glucuronosyltransferase 2A3 [Mollisia scopiformis]
MDPTKPLVIIGCTPVYGHLMPIRAMAKLLVQRGYEVTFVSCSHYQKLVEEVGCHYVAIEGYGDWYEAELNTRFAERNTLPPGPVQLSYDIEHCFVRPIPTQHEAMQKAIKMNMERHPGRPIVQLSESVFQGSLPVNLGAGIKPTATMGIGVIPMSLSSCDTAPFGPGLPPDSSLEGRAKYAAMSKQIAELFFGKPERVWKEMFVEVGATIPELPMFDAPFYLQDRFLQMCTPSAEYPRSDAPDTIRFTGGLPKGSRDPMTEFPSFWKEITAGDKDIVFICQGTIALNYSDLIIPAMAALKDRPNTIVVVALGIKGEKFPEGTFVPENARVADYIPFDELLPRCSVFLTNGGYGAFQHAIANGVPIICGGAGEDKPEVCARVEWSGMGINLKTGQPTQEQISEAVDQIIKNPKYRKRAKEMEAEMASFDPISVVAANIDELAALKAGK